MPLKLGGTSRSTSKLKSKQEWDNTDNEERSVPKLSIVSFFGVSLMSFAR